MKLLTNILLVVLSLLIFIYVLFYVPYPKSWQQASTIQILAFFIPILLFFTFLTNVLLNNINKSTAIGLGFMVLFVMQASKVLNLITGAATIVFFIFLASKMPKSQFKRHPHIPKIKFKSQDKH